MSKASSLSKIFLILKVVQEVQEHTYSCAGKEINTELAPGETYAGHYCSSDPKYKTEKHTLNILSSSSGV